MKPPKMPGALTPDERDRLALLAARDAGGVYLSPVRLDELRRMLDDIAKAPRGVGGPGSRSWALQHLTDYVAGLLVIPVPADRV
jgi:hypothetical protein